MNDRDRIQTLLVESHDHPYVTFNVVLRMGALDDPPGKEGLAYLASNLMLRGTARRSYSELVEAVDRLGSSMPMLVGKEYSELRSDALVRHLPRLAALVAECLTEYDCPADELMRLRRQTQAELRLLRNHDDELAQHLAHRLLYDGHPFGNPTRGTEESLEHIHREDITAFLGRHMRRGGMLIASAGDITPGDIDGVRDGPFSAVPGGEAPEAAFPVERPLDGRTLLLIDKPARTQTQVVFAAPCISARHPDYYAMLVANTIFGGTFTSRLSHEVREKRGWSYGANSSFAPTYRTGSFWMRYAPENENTADAVRLGLDMLEELVADGVTEEEVRFAHKTLTNRFPFKVDTAPKRLEQALSGVLLGWSPDWLDHYVANVKAQGKAEVERAIQAYLDPGRLIITVLCTVAEVGDALRGLPGLARVHVHPYDKEWVPGRFAR